MDESMSQKEKTAAAVRPRAELLAPAGTREALDAAIRAGADAVYFGGSRFNARMAADNFAGDAMGDAIRLCAAYGVKSNITLNTLPCEKEQADVLRYAEELCRWGADAVICADLGTAALIHRYFPELPLHASTQCAGHNTDAARFFAAQGFSRMVAARELSFADLQTLCRESPIETELFIHGAICVSQSGGCLFSSLVGGRSGNRGACAQPCRLPYHCSADGNMNTNGRKTGRTGKYEKEEYPLSIRDMCLANHIPELLSLGAASFKIEGRMKSPAYVEGVISTYRRLIDEERNADERELAFLASLFSRGGGFTDGYFRAKTGSFMQGTRTETDKNATAAAEKAVLSGRHEPKRLPADLVCKVKAGEPVTLSVTCGDECVTVTGEIPAPAENRAVTEDDLVKNLSKLGQTPFSAHSVSAVPEDGLSLPTSAVNALRRDAAEQLEARIFSRQPHPERREHAPLFSGTGNLPEELTAPRTGYTGSYAYPRQASFLFTDRIPQNARRFYDILYLPLDVLARDPASAVRAGVNGVELPPVIFDREKDAVRAMLEKAREAGISHVLLSNAGHIALAEGFTLHGGLRCNVYTGLSSDVWAEAGLSDGLLSPELTRPQLRDVKTKIPRGIVTYGRIPLMTLQRCIIREAAHIPDGKPCRHCDSVPYAVLCDRIGAAFPVTRCYPHRNILWNSAPVWMADKPETVREIAPDFTHHIFTTESARQAEEIMRAYAGGAADTVLPKGGSLPSGGRLPSGGYTRIRG